MPEKKIRFTVDEIIANPFLTCDFILVKEQREKLFNLEDKELIRFMKLLSNKENAKKLAKLIDSKQYDNYLKIQKNPSSLTKEIQAIGISVGQGVGQTLLFHGLPIPVIEVFTAIKKKLSGGKGEELVSDLIMALSQENIKRRLEFYIEKKNITDIDLDDFWIE
ncbi:hypothetical protein COM34_14655 [Bacillus wiedmannii]|uniref:hypothetical protein n=1 Tax=Bacillus wiedmannii TaxID=1890302 RepID=UPI000BF494DB|nr:hypothetical protein [Bacillus wiedmannii]PGD07597.1 hypothetical protein COM34_14655 [Bacillus wiedmannii]